MSQTSGEQTACESRRRTDPWGARVLIVDSSPCIWEFLEHALAKEPRAEFIGSASTAEGALELVKATEPDVIVTAIAGLAIHTWVPLIRRGYPATRVLVFSGHCGTRMIKYAFDLGVSGYVAKPATSETIVDAVLAVAAGETVLLR